MDCQMTYPVIGEPRCMKCGKPIVKDTEEFCYDCSHRTHYFEWGRSLWKHQFPVNDAIYAFKYKNRRIYGYIFARKLAEEYGEVLKRSQIDLIVPIPLHKSRRSSRGYNQTEILADYLGQYTGIAVDKKVLVRTKKTLPQKRYDNAERKKNIKNAFMVSGKICAKKVVLIDDIYTTGSTIDEAAKVLRNAGVSNVFFLTISIGQGY